MDIESSGCQSVMSSLYVVCIDGVCPVCEFGECLLGRIILCISHIIITRLALEPFECILTASSRLPFAGCVSLELLGLRLDY